MQAKFYKQISALGMLHMYWQWCISDGQCGFNEFIESYYMVQFVLPIVYPILVTGSMNLLNPYHMTQCVHSVAHIIWYTVTSLCGDWKFGACHCMLCNPVIFLFFRSPQILTVPLPPNFWSFLKHANPVGSDLALPQLTWTPILDWEVVSWCMTAEFVIEFVAELKLVTEAAFLLNCSIIFAFAINSWGIALAVSKCQLVSILMLSHFWHPKLTVESNAPIVEPRYMVRHDSTSSTLQSWLIRLWILAYLNNSKTTKPTFKTSISGVPRLGCQATHLLHHTLSLWGKFCSQPVQTVIVQSKRWKSAQGRGKRKEGCIVWGILFAKNVHVWEGKYRTV